jgi:Winged helix DNA-binding domain
MAALRAHSALDVKKQQALGLDAVQLSTIVEAIRTALDSRQLTMQQLGEEIVRRVGSWAGETTGQAWGGGWPRWRLALGEAALDGVLCYGPPQGTQVTFVRSDQWIGRRVDRQAAAPNEALAEVFRRYLRAYGPATPRDFAQWFNLAPRAARELATRLQDELQEVEVESYRCYLLRDEAETVGVTADFAAELPPRLLPHFDCYVIGCHPRERLLDAIWRERVPPRTIPSQVPVLLVDGMVAGLWERETKGKRIEVRVEPFASLDRRQRSLVEEEASRIGLFLGVEADLTIGPVSVRPHL